MKKNTVQKLLAIGLSCILSVGMLAGCGSKTESGAGAATGEAGGAESTPAAESTADTSASTDKASGDIPHPDLVDGGRHHSQRLYGLSGKYQ